MNPSKKKLFPIKRKNIIGEEKKIFHMNNDYLKIKIVKGTEDNKISFRIIKQKYRNDELKVYFKNNFKYFTSTGKITVFICSNRYPDIYDDFVGEIWFNIRGDIKALDGSVLSISKNNFIYIQQAVLEYNIVLAHLEKDILYEER